MVILSIELAKQFGLLGQPEPVTERRVVNTVNSDSVAYSLAEFQSYFGDAWQKYLTNAIRLQSTTVKALPRFDESDTEELPPFVSFAVDEDRWCSRTKKA